MATSDVLPREDPLLRAIQKAQSENTKEAITDCAVSILNVLQYNDRHKRQVHKSKKFFYFWNLEYRECVADVCFVYLKRLQNVEIENVGLVICVQEAGNSSDDVEYRVVEAAIASFAHENRTRRFNDLEPLSSDNIHGIAFRGTSISHFNVQVTTHLIDHFIKGEVDIQQILEQVEHKVPKIIDMDVYWKEGMMDWKCLNEIVTIFNTIRGYLSGVYQN
ncbi:hypothetical protein BDQ17DRAFT_1433474 [Cyathus striatus]|nr:hypothetical protein BDQ17DRAFT_1433474 [Cyathus striatus]